MDDNYGPAPTDHSRRFIEWRVENKKIAGVFFFFFFVFSPNSQPSQHTERGEKMCQQLLMLH